MSWLLSRIEVPVDRALLSVNESLRSFTHEAWQYSSQLANGWSAFALGFLHKPAAQNYFEHKNRIQVIDPEDPNFGVSPFASILSPFPSRKVENEFSHSESEPDEPIEDEQLNISEPRISEIINPSFFAENKLSKHFPSAFSRRKKKPIPKHMDDSNRLGISHPSLNGEPRKQPQQQIRSMSDPKFSSRSLLDHHAKDEFSDDMVHQYETATTGLLEDVRLWQLSVIDWVISKIRWIWHSLFTFLTEVDLLSLFSLSILAAPFRLISWMWGLFVDAILLLRYLISSAINFLYQPSEIFNQRGIDNRSKNQIVTEAGYPYEIHKVVTEDGYIITLERLPRPNAKQVIYFQHGVIDSGFTWLASGNTTSIAMAAYDNGYDVFLGNFRGDTRTSHIDPNISSARYWDFSVNHHAWKDIPAFVRYIQETKRKELGDPEGNEDLFSMTCVAHSMGGMATLMYLVKCGMDDVPCGMSKVVLLSPAGIHEDSPPLVKIVAPMVDWALRFVPGVHCLRFPSELLRVVSAKIMEDVKSTHPTRDLFTYFATILIGGKVDNHSLNRVNVVRWVFAGTPLGVFLHFRQLISSGKFLGYDYGKERNMKEYGSPEPINILENYDKIPNIPVFFMMGLLDNLIRPANVIKHFEVFSKTHPKMAYLKAFANAGHVDFTLGVSEEMTNVLLSALEPTPAPEVTFHSLPEHGC